MTPEMTALKDVYKEIVHREFLFSHNNDLNFFREKAERLQIKALYIRAGNLRRKFQNERNYR